MDPTMPVVLALAIAGDRIAGGVGTHETGACLARSRRPRRPLRPAGLQRRARPLPDLGARAAGGAARGRDVAGRGARAASRPPLPTLGAGTLAPRPGLAQRRLVARGRADAPGARRGHRRDADGPHGPRLPLALAELGRARGCRRGSAGRGRRRRARRGRRADRRPARGVGLAVPRPVPPRSRTTSSSTRCATA